MVTKFLVLDAMGCGFRGMENSNGTHSGKGKVSKGNVGKWRNSSISGTVLAKDSRR